MRQYIIRPSRFGLGMLIVGEVYASPEGDAAAELEQRADRLRTRDQLLRDPAGHRALEAWEAGDDSRADQEARRADDETAAGDELFEAARAAGVDVSDPVTYASIYGFEPPEE